MDRKNMKRYVNVVTIVLGVAIACAMVCYSFLVRTWLRLPASSRSVRFAFFFAPFRQNF
jgi:cytochrome c-type biogenesis protein CcmE